MKGIQLVARNPLAPIQGVITLLGLGAAMHSGVDITNQWSIRRSS